MSRKRSIDSNIQLTLTKEYFDTICKNDLRLFTYPQIAEYIYHKTGVDIK